MVLVDGVQAELVDDAPTMDRAATTARNLSLHFHPRKAIVIADTVVPGRWLIYLTRAPEAPTA